MQAPLPPGCKLVHFCCDIDEWELYDLQEDPEEMNNLYGSPEHSEIQLELHKRLSELRDHYQDSDSLDKMFIEKDLQRLKELRE